MEKDIATRDGYLLVCTFVAGSVHRTVVCLSGSTMLKLKQVLGLRGSDRHLMAEAPGTRRATRSASLHRLATPKQTNGNRPTPDATARMRGDGNRTALRSIPRPRQPVSLQ